MCDCINKGNDYHDIVYTLLHLLKFNFVCPGACTLHNKQHNYYTRNIYSYCKFDIYDIFCRPIDPTIIPQNMKLVMHDLQDVTSQMIHSCNQNRLTSLQSMVLHDQFPDLVTMDHHEDA